MRTRKPKDGSRGVIFTVDNRPIEEDDLDVKKQLKQLRGRVKSPYRRMANRIVEAFEAAHGELAEASAAERIAQLVQLMDGDASNQLLQELKRIDARINPHLYDAKPLKRKAKR